MGVTLSPSVRALLSVFHGAQCTALSTPTKEIQPQVPSSPGLFSDEEIIISEILSVDTDNITPINALQIITRWKKTLSGQ